MKYNLSLSLFLSLFIIVLGYFVSQRDFSIGADTDSYKYYHSVIAEADNFDVLSGVEPGFFLLNKGSAIVSDSFRFFLFFEYILFNLLYFLFFREFSKFLNLNISILQLLLFIGFTLFSSWYILFSLNGLRQGLATPLIYLSFLHIIRKKYLISIFLMIIAFFIHSSSILIFPFFPL